MADAKGVLVIDQVIGGTLSDDAKELLGTSFRMAGFLGEDVLIGLMGDDMGSAPEEALAHGANKVYTVTHPLLQHYRTDAYTKAAMALIHEASPNILLMAHTVYGADLAPHLAVRLDTGLSTDCVELEIDEETQLMRAIRPVFGGTARVVMVCEDARPQMVTVRRKTQDPLEADQTRQGEILAVDLALEEGEIRTKLLDRVREEVTGVRLEDARLIVSGGRGIGSSEGFEPLYELAGVLGAAVGASRAACDQGFIDHSHQVGLTGKMVAPDLYIAIGISGASQHLAGLSGAKNILAINKDSECNMFREARFGVVGDWEKVIPAFTDACRNLGVN